MAGLELHEAASTGDYDLLEEYLKTGKFDVNTKDTDWGDRTPLHWACAKGYVECIRLLLEHGADGNMQTDTGFTCAHFAAEAGKVTVLRALHSANIPLDTKDNYGDKPIDFALVYGNEECVKFLMMVDEEKKLPEKLENIDHNEDKGKPTIEAMLGAKAKDYGKH